MPKPFLAWRLRKNPELFEEYNHIIEVGHFQYLPHHPVVHRDKQTTRVRIVYDVFTKSTGPVLKECLHAGPSSLSDIPNVLMHFRYHRVALVGDIEKAFLMVQIKEADGDVLSFPWLDDT